MKGKQPGGSLRAVDWTRERLEPFEKNLYNVTDSSRNADPREVEAFRYVVSIKYSTESKLALIAFSMY